MALSALTSVSTLFTEYKNGLIALNNLVSQCTQTINALNILQADPLYGTYASASDTNFINNTKTSLASFVSAMSGLPPPP